MDESTDGVGTGEMEAYHGFPQHLEVWGPGGQAPEKVARLGVKQTQSNHMVPTQNLGDSKQITGSQQLPLQHAGYTQAQWSFPQLGSWDWAILPLPLLDATVSTALKPGPIIHAGRPRTLPLPFLLGGVPGTHMS